MPNFGKNIAVWITILIVIMVFVRMIGDGIDGNSRAINLAFSDFIQNVNNGKVTDVLIKNSDKEGTIIKGHLSDGKSFKSYSPDYPDLVNKLTENNVKISAEPYETDADKFWSEILSWFPFLLLIAVYIFFMRQMQGGKGGGGAMGFGKSKARLLTEKHGKKTFDDVAGIDEAQEELGEIVGFLRNPEKYQKLGGKIPRGCLLVGPPGTGKTLLARAIAGEAEVPFFTISGSDFVEMFVGVGASRVRDMFEQGKKNAPCIIFIDEIDAVGRHRGQGMGGGNDEREQTLNQLLVEMDGFEDNEGVIILAATNRPDVLDPALLRPGRFDRQITVSNPDIKGREQILNVHIKNVPIAPDVDLKIIARGTPGFSGADLSNLINEAALLAARMNKKVVTMKELEGAKDKVMMGVERKSMLMSDEEKKMTAYHEAGHAVVAAYSPACDPIHKATIIPRGRALGMVMRLPEADQLSYLREKMYGDLAVAMGGRAAEEITFGYDKVSSGASSDISYATKLSTAMVTEWGMSDKIGSVNCSSHDAQGNPQYVSPQTMAKIDEEVRRLIEEAEQKATDILTTNKVGFEAVAKALLEYETLTGDEIKTLLDGKEIRKEDITGKKIKVLKSSLPFNSSAKNKTSDSESSLLEDETESNTNDDKKE